MLHPPRQGDDIDGEIEAHEVEKILVPMEHGLLEHVHAHVGLGFGFGLGFGLGFGFGSGSGSGSGLG